MASFEISSQQLQIFYLYVRVFCSFKQIKSCIKDDESLLITKKSKGLDISRIIYDLIVGGIKGDIKKDALLSTISELAVSNSCYFQILLLYINEFYLINCYSPSIKIWHLSLWIFFKS